MIKSAGLQMLGCGVAGLMALVWPVFMVVGALGIGFISRQDDVILQQHVGYDHPAGDRTTRVRIKGADFFLTPQETRYRVLANVLFIGGCVGGFAGILLWRRREGEPVRLPFSSNKRL